MNLKSIYIKPFRLLVHSSQFKLGFLTFARIKVCIINYFSFKIRLSKGTPLPMQGVAGLIPGQGAKIPHASGPKHKTEAILKQIQKRL